MFGSGDVHVNPVYQSVNPEGRSQHISYSNLHVLENNFFFYKCLAFVIAYFLH
jgi:hypothetical protein